MSEQGVKSEEESEAIKTIAGLIRKTKDRAEL